MACFSVWKTAWGLGFYFTCGFFTHPHRMATSMPMTTCTGGGEEPLGVASQEALVQDRLKEAEEKVAHLNTMIAGPPPLEVMA